MDRKGAVHALANAIFDGFIKDDGGEWLSRTGTVVPSSNLRVHKTRRAFEMVRASISGVDQKRCWTKAILRDALAHMMKTKHLQVPQTSGFTWPEWLKEQVSNLHSLSQKARKNAWRRMDPSNFETLPYQVEDCLPKRFSKPVCLKVCPLKFWMYIMLEHHFTTLQLFRPPLPGLAV